MEPACSEGIRFVQGEFDDDDAFERLGDVIDELDETRGTRGNHAFYLSIPPKAFEQVCRQLSKHGLAQAEGGQVAPRGHREAVRA